MMNENSIKFHRNDTLEIYRKERPVDRNDHASEGTAIEYSLPFYFSKKAWQAWDYLDDTAYIFAYKGRLVVTDESLELTDAGDGTRENPIGGPRFVADSWEEIETWLEAVADDMDEE